MQPSRCLSSPKSPVPARASWRALLALLVCGIGGDLVCAPPATSFYEQRQPSSRDGTGRFYRGREIAQVMGHQGAWWLERAERETEERPGELIEALDLQPGAVVADLGAGSGYFTRRLARAVGPEGRVYAVDIQPEMLALLRKRCEAAGLRNVVPVQATERDPKLPAGTLDLVLLVDVYHELAWPHEVMTQVREALKPEGRVAFVEYRAEDPSVPIKPLHKMTEAQVKKEARGQGFEHVRTIRTLPRQHLILFRRAARP